MIRSILPSGDGRRRSLVVALVVLWAAELFFVQESTLVETHYYAAFQPLLHRLVRASLDLASCAILVLIMPRALLALTFGASLVLSGVLLSFANYTGTALSATMIFANAGEGAAVVGAGYEMLPPIFAVLVVTLVVKLFLLYRLGKLEHPNTSARLSRAAKLGVVYLGIIGVTSFYKPFSLLLGWETTGGIGSVYGYAPTWTAELILLDHREILARAQRRAEIPAEDLRGRESAFPVGERLVLLQVESLDSAVLEFDVDGEPVTPNLRALAERSMSYAIRSPKKTGSCDADFTALMGQLPSEDMPNYKIRGFPFGGSFVSELAGAGFYTVAIHNVGGGFFSRRPAFEAMGFDELLFKEELVDHEGLEDREWATPDHVMLDFAADHIASRSDRVFATIITATSHIPFDYTPTDLRRFFPGSDDLTESYLDSMRYVDEAVGSFVDALPPGTVVVIYGDHGSGVGSDALGYRNPERDGVGLVPFLIHRVGEDLRAVQRTRASGLASSGNLTLHDTISYVHSVVRESIAR